MDIEFIEEEHRDNIFKIMELCNCEMAEAYELYNNNGCNVEVTFLYFRMQFKPSLTALTILYLLPKTILNLPTHLHHTETTIILDLETLK